MRRSFLIFMSLLPPALLVLPAAPALAAGFALREQSTEAMGEAYAGAAATGSDAGFLSYNPASASATDGGDFALSAITILPDSSASYSTALTAAGTPTGGNAAPNGFIRNAVIPDLAIRQRLSSQWSVGLSVSVPWGLSTKYPDGWAGRYYALGSKLSTINITPVVSYDLLPNVSIAAGFQAQYAKGILSSAVDIGTIGALAHIPGAVPGAADGSSTITASGWGYGYVLGARASLGDGWTLGVSYRSQVRSTLTGAWTFGLDNFGLGAAIRGATGLLTNTTASARLVTPAEVETGLRKKLDERWTLLAEADWTDWSSFQNLTAVAANPVQPAEVLNANWHSSWMGSVGAEYQADDNLVLRLGAAIDGTPVPAATLAPRIPDASRTWIALGATWHASPDLDLKLSYGHLFDNTRKISQTAAMTGNAARGTLIGSTASDVNVVGFALDYRWQ